MKNILLLDNYYSPDDLKAEIETFVEYYNYQRYHESLNNVTPADVYTGRAVQILEERNKIKERTPHTRNENTRNQLPSDKLCLRFQYILSKLSDDVHSYNYGQQM